MPAINVDGLRVNYNDTGSGMPIVFVPGLAGAKDWFYYQALGLADHYRIISYDMRRSRNQTAYTHDILTDDLIRLLDRLRIYAAVVVGHGLGGLIAMQFAAMHPECCPALILCSTSPSFPRLSDDEFISHMLPGEVKLESAIVRWWKRWFGRKAGPCAAEPNAILTECLSKIDHVTLAKRMNILRNTDLTSLVSEIEVPTLVTASTDDAAYILAGSQVLEESIPNASLEIIEGTDRFYFHTRHDLFNAIIDDYLAEKIALF
ncbi:alpha/beta hydrolase [bacterium]|nr:alpha/beta hydrolase [bacterium]